MIMRKFLWVAVLAVSGMMLTAAPSPWDSWRAGYTNFEQGEARRERGNYTEALKYFEKARKNYLAVRSARPDWNQRVIADRLRDCDRQIAELKRLLNEGSNQQTSMSASPPATAGQTTGQTTGQTIGQTTGQTAGQSSGGNRTTYTPAVPLANDRELARLQVENAQLRLANGKLGKEIQRQRNFESEIAALLRDRKVATDRYLLLEKRFKALQEELKRPDERIAVLEQKLLDERMNIERINKQLASLEQQLRIERENARLSTLAKNALEDLLKRRNDELLNCNQQITALSERLKEIDTLNARISELNVQLAAQAAQVATLNNRIAELNQQNVELTRQGSSLQSSNTGLAGQITVLNNRLAASENLLKERESEIERLKREIAEKASAVSAAETELASLRAAVASARKEAGEAAAREAAARQAAAEASARESAAREAAAVASAREKAAREAAAREAAARQAAAEAAKNAGDQVISGAAESAELQKKLQDLNSRITTLELQIAALEAQKNELQTQLKTVVSTRNKLSEENEKLKKELAELRRIFGETQTQLKAANERIRVLDDELVTAREQLTAERKQLADTGIQLTAVQKQLSETRGQLSVVSGNYSTSQEQLESAGVQLDALKKQYVLLEDTLAKLRKEHESLGLALHNEKAKNSSLSNEKRILQANFEQEQNASRLSAAELANLRERNRSLEEDIKQLSERAGELEKRLAMRNSADFQAATAARNSVKKLEDDLLAAQNELIRLRSDLDANKKTMEDYERKLKAVNDENAKARAEVIAAAEREKILRQQLSQLHQLQSRYEQLQRDFNALAAENRENRSLLEAARPGQAELERAKLRLMELDQLKSTLAKEQQLSAEMKAAYSRMERELTDLRRRAVEFEAARRKLVELEARAKEAARMKELESELSRLQAREGELAALKVRHSEVESSLRAIKAEYETSLKNWEKLSAELTALRRDNAELKRLRRLNGELQEMLNNQNMEMERLSAQLAAARDNKKDLHVSCRLEIERFRAAAADAAAEVTSATAPLNRQIGVLQDEVARLKTLTAALQTAQAELNRQLNLRNTEIAELRKVNSDLANMQKSSATALLNEMDLARVTRLEDEIAALNKLNAALAAERDKLLAVVNNRPSGEKTPAAGPAGIKDNRPPEELTGAGFVAEKDGKSELAIWNYRQALTNDPDFTLAHLRLGMLFFRRGSCKEAIPHLEKALNSSPENLQLSLDTARCYIALKRFGDAKSIIDPLEKKYPENAYVQMCAALIEAGCGAAVRAEEKLLTAARLAPHSAEIQIELSRLLASSITDRRREAVIAYEKARQLGAAPVPELEKLLGSMLDQRRELVRFMAGAAREAELNNDWLSAVWYYKKIMEDDHPEYLPLLAFAQWRSGNISSAKETLEFNQVSRNAMVIRALIALSENDMENAMRAAQQSAGAKIPVEWIGVNHELDKLKKQQNPPAAIRILLKSIAPQAQ